MNPYARTNLSNFPIVQTWEPRGKRYGSPFEYTCDPVNAKVAQTWDDIKCQREYSASKKVYQPVIPHDPIPPYFSPYIVDFDWTRLKQTDVLTLINSQNPSPYQLQTVSLASVISRLFNKMGTMEDITSREALGTCTLITHNQVLVARHAIAGFDVRSICVRFGYIEYEDCSYCAAQTKLSCIYEENAVLDYAIVQLEKPLGSQLGFVLLNTEGFGTLHPALLHYPLEKPLKVSVHSWEQTNFQTDYMLTYHDSDYYSSGGAYFDTNGCMIGMHLGTEMLGETMSLLRYARPLEAIARRNPFSLFNHLKSGEFNQSKSYFGNPGFTCLNPVPHNYLIDEEGRKAEKVLSDLLKNELKNDRNIKLNKNGTINFSKGNINYIAQNYTTKYSRFIAKCLGVTGLHGDTRDYSVAKKIESDHTIPHDVWKNTSHPIMEDFMKNIAVGGKRPGENEMPAITIPWEVHRHLKTTVSKSFREELRILCDQGKVAKALILCYQDYKDKGLDLKAYKNDINASLDAHVDIGLISIREKEKIVKFVKSIS